MNKTGHVVLFQEEFASWEETLEVFILFRKAEGVGHEANFCQLRGIQVNCFRLEAEASEARAPKLGLKRLSPYDLRHDAALHFLRNSMNPFALQVIMGHSNLETTKHYIALVEVDIREAQKKASPVRRLVGKK